MTNKLPSSFNTKYYYQEFEDLTKHELWVWYWKVRLTKGLGKSKKSIIWKYYDYLLHEERYENIRATI
jgi:hypothetical protein